MLPAGPGGVREAGSQGTILGPMAPRARPPFRADHVGSLLRPPRLLQRARRPRRRAGSTPTSCGRSRTTRSATSCAMQRDAGLQRATDGEFRRASWHMDFIYQLGGVSQVEDERSRALPQRGGRVDFSPPALRVDGRVRSSTRSSATRSRSCASTVTRRDAEADDPVAEHGALPRRAGRDRRGRVPRDRRVLDRPHRGLREEVRRLAALGCTYLQLDDTSLAYLNDPSSARRAPSTAATPSTSTRGTSATSTPRSPAARTGMRVTTHMCRGNFRSSWAAEGGYDFVAEALFTSSRSTASSSSTTTPARAASSRCASCRTASSSCSAWSRPSAASSRARTSSSAGSTRRRATSPRPALPLAAVRLLLDRRGQRADVDEEVAKLGWSSRPRRGLGLTDETPGRPGR